jgi:divalent metal cation (Fe/Co/Zn/Cd) transporter
MTIEQANAAALQASMTGDLEALHRALAERREAIRELAGGEASPELLSRVRSAIGAGEFIAKDLGDLKERLAGSAARVDLQG